MKSATLRDRCDIDPIRNLPVGVFNLVLNHLNGCNLKNSCFVSRQWHEVISRSETFLDTHERCKFVIAGDSYFNSLSDVNPSRFKKMEITSHAAEDDPVSRFFRDYPIVSEKTFHDEHTTKFSKYLTTLSLYDLIFKRTTLTCFLQFLTSCRKLKNLNLSLLRRDTCLNVAPVKFSHLEYLSTYKSDWILQYLICDKIEQLSIVSVNDENDVSKYEDSSIIFFESDSNSITKFMNSIVQLDSLQLKEVDFSYTDEILNPSFKWKKIEICYGSCEFDFSWHRNWRMLLGVCEEEAELEVLFTEGATYLGGLLNIISECTNISKLKIEADSPRGRKFRNDIENIRINGVKQFSVDIETESFSDFGRRCYYELLLKLFPNAETINLGFDPFQIRPEMSAKIFQNTKRLAIKWWYTAEIADYFLPELVHFEVHSIEEKNLNELEKFLHNQPNLKSFTTRFMANGNQDIKQRLQNVCPHIEIIIRQ